MSVEFDVTGMSFSGELPKGLEAMALFQHAAEMAREMKWFDAGDDVSRSYAVSDLAGHAKGLAYALDTLRGWRANGVEITRENFVELFAKPGLYLVPYVAAIRIWVDSGFLSVRDTSKAGQ